MKIKIIKDSSILEKRKRFIEEMNQEFIKEEFRMSKELNPDMTDQEKKINFFEVFSNIGKETEELKFEWKHRLITINDEDLGNLISIECEPENEVFLEIPILNLAWAK